VVILQPLVERSVGEKKEKKEKKGEKDLAAATAKTVSSKKTHATPVKRKIFYFYMRPCQPKNLFLFYTGSHLTNTKNKTLAHYTLALCCTNVTLQAVACLQQC
jgi:hypothetical protein